MIPSVFLLILFVNGHNFINNKLSKIISNNTQLYHVLAEQVAKYYDIQFHNMYIYINYNLKIL